MCLIIIVPIHPSATGARPENSMQASRGYSARIVEQIGSNTLGRVESIAAWVDRRHSGRSIAWRV